MIKASELRSGLLVVWKKEGFVFSPDFYFSCYIPCVVTEVNTNEKTFRVMCFDDFQETEPMEIPNAEEDGCSFLWDMRACSEAELQDYLSDRIISMWDSVKKTHGEIEVLKEKLDEQQRSAEEYEERVAGVFEEIAELAN